jgi:hypothetical protein
VKRTLLAAAAAFLAAGRNSQLSEQIDNASFAAAVSCVDCSDSDTLVFVRRKNFLNTYLIDQVISFQISEMRPLFVICQMSPNALGHYQYESGISHVQPIAPPNKFVRSVASERAVWVGAKIRFVKAGQSKAPQHC